MTKHYEQRKASNERYLSKLDEIRIRMPKESGLKEAIQAHAEAHGESVNAFILRAVQETIERDSGRLRPRSYTLTENWAEFKYD
jgi:predicted HicB family RNase H-like nuclease